MSTASGTPEHADALHGFFDGCDGLVVHGWACDTSRPGAPVELDVIVDGATVCQVVADRFRPDLQAGGYGDGRHGFLTILPGSLCDARRHVVVVCAAETGTRLHGGPRDLILPPEFHAAVEPRLAERFELQHRLTVNELSLLNEGRRLAGWTCDALHPMIGDIYARVVASWPAPRSGEEE